jgi:uncharacterized protein YbaR (Trm112 family)
MSKDSSENTSQAVVVTANACDQCGRRNPAYYFVRVESIRRTDDGWIADGEGRRYIYCGDCAQMYEAISHAIPIQCEPFACPGCKGFEDLQYNIIRIDAKQFTFEFTVEIGCKKCKRKRTLKKLIERLLQVAKIEISPTGISIKKN